jgi:hypothetical protein
MGIPKKVADKRSATRIPYSGHLIFTTKNGLCEGELKNYSKNGLFIKTQEVLTLGDFITVALPYVEDEQIKFQACIFRSIPATDSGRSRPPIPIDSGH